MPNHIDIDSALATVRAVQPFVTPIPDSLYQYAVASPARLHEVINNAIELTKDRITDGLQTLPITTS